MLRLAGPREPAPADRMRRVRAVVHAEWRGHIRARSRRITIAWWIGALASAALVLIAMGFSVRDTTVVEGPPLATVEALSGAVHLSRSPSGRPAELALLQVGDRVRAGEGVETTSGGLAALRLSGGASVRVDRGTRVRILSDTTLGLDGGAIYIDSGGREGERAIEVRTTLGVVRDIGTRFEVRLTASSLRVRVRTGLVRVSQSLQSHEANAGDELTLDGRGSLARRTTPVYGLDWAWVTTIAQPFELEGRSLGDFLDWISGENGWQLRYESTSTENMAQAAILRGSVRGLAPQEALAAVLPVSGAWFRLENGELHVGSAK